MDRITTLEDLSKLLDYLRKTNQKTAEVAPSRILRQFLTWAVVDETVMSVLMNNLPASIVERSVLSPADGALSEITGGSAGIRR